MILLGGEFYVNVNQFAERDFPVDNVANQFDLDNPNRILKEEINSDMIIISTSTKLLHGHRVFSNSVKWISFWPEQFPYTNSTGMGNARNGLFPNDSYGKGTVNDFTNYGGKGGVTYKINGRNYIYANGSYQTRSPYFENVYISPRTRNAQQNNIKSETIQTGEAGYIMNAPKFKIRLGGYYTQFPGWYGCDVILP